MKRTLLIPGLVVATLLGLFAVAGAASAAPGQAIVVTAPTVVVQPAPRPVVRRVHPARIARARRVARAYRTRVALRAQRPVIVRRAPRRPVRVVFQ